MRSIQKCNKKKHMATITSRVSDVFFSCVERSVTIVHEFLRRIHLLETGNSGRTRFILQPDLFQTNTNNPIAKKISLFERLFAPLFGEREHHQTTPPQPETASTMAISAAYAVGVCRWSLTLDAASYPSTSISRGRGDAFRRAIISWRRQRSWPRHAALLMQYANRSS